MTVHIAHDTLNKIEGMIEADQGAQYRGWLGKVIPHIGDAYNTSEEGFRTHLGASIVGGECARHIYYSWHWTTKPKFSGRTLRLFNRGHLEEARFIAMFLMIGCEVIQQDAQGKQFRISWASGHAGGSGDGIIIGLPELSTGMAALAEFKTYGEKSFIELAGPLKEWRAHREDPSRNPFKGQGVRAAKFEHYVQMQTYMEKMKLPVGIYGAVNKNTDDLYMELVVRDTPIADQFSDRGENIVWAKEPPKRLSESPGFWKCHFCDDKPVCHLGASPAVNCRTCEFSSPVDDGVGGWACDKHGSIDKATQLVGCKDYAVNRKF